tara:strand:- start:564 stop:881 length:318 start_codon:yes stop_codon:yes gene_type:complete
MRKNGVDFKAFAARLDSASPDERKEMWAKYRAWIVRGAKSQGWKGIFGGIAVALSLFLLLSAVLHQFGSPILYLAILGTASFGVILVRQGWRNEREWREANPFEL